MDKSETAIACAKRHVDLLQPMLEAFRSDMLKHKYMAFVFTDVVGGGKFDVGAIKPLPEMMKV